MFNKKRQFNLFLVLTGFLLPLILVTSPAFTESASAAGEKYEWVNNKEIKASGGGYKNPVSYFKKSNSNLFYSVTASDTSTNSSFEDISGCKISQFSLEISSDKKKGELTFQFLDITSHTCSVDTVNSYDKSVTLSNSGNEGNNAPQEPDTKQLIILAIVPDGMIFPGSSDRITITRNGKAVAAANGNPYKLDDTNKGNHGYKASFNDIDAGDGYKACSRALKECIAFKKDRSVINIPDTHTITGKGIDPSAAGKSCESEGGPLAWLFCAVIDALDGVINFLDNEINNLLFIKSDNYSSESIDKAWAVIRNIALLILVPMMMFMVIGTAVGFGPFDAYTVKKALPRMLIAIIFIVLSLPITQFGIELSNAVGQGAGNLIVSAVPEEQRINSIGDIINNGDVGDLGQNTFGGLVLIGAGIAAVGTTIGIILSMALVTAIALLVGFVILVIRQVLILTLIVIAPIAILVWIFPGNDKLWGIWKNTFIAMLMLYPIIAVLIASGRFVASIAGGVN